MTRLQALIGQRLPVFQELTKEPIVSPKEHILLLGENSNLNPNAKPFVPKNANIKKNTGTTELQLTAI